MSWRVLQMSRTARDRRSSSSVPCVLLQSTSPVALGEYRILPTPEFVCLPRALCEYMPQAGATSGPCSAPARTGRSVVAV
jgi:hypothetical protein